MISCSDVERLEHGGLDHAVLWVLSRRMDADQCSKITPAHALQMLDITREQFDGAVALLEKLDVVRITEFGDLQLRCYCEHPSSGRS